MSLINEALKRAEDEKLRRTSPSPDPMELPAAHDKGYTGRAGSRRWLVIGGLIFISLFAVWAAIENMLFSPAPRRAAARSITAWREKTGTAGNRPAQRTAADFASTDAATSKPSKVKPTSPETDLASVQSTEENPQKTPTPAPAIPVTATRPVFSHPQPAQTKPTTSPATMPAPVKRTDIRLRVNPSQYKVSGIIDGPDGAAAIINGSFVSVGDEVDGAKVIHITSRSVELEAYGQRFTIRL